MDSRWGFLLFGRALPSTFFLWGFYFGLNRFPDPQSILSEPTLTGVFNLFVESVGRLVGLVHVFLFAVRKQVIGRRASLSGALVALVASFYGSFGIFFNALGLRPPQPTQDGPLAAIAGVMGVGSTLLIWWSVPNLGRHIGIFPEVRGLSTTGPYRYFRHPLYVAYLLSAGASFLLGFSKEAIVIFAVYYALVAWRAAFEERALETVFGDKYRNYRLRTIGVGPPGGLGGWMRDNAV
jgi:protein-S-isoprenylcysteine O-methyltransferase Ste14